YRTLAAIVDAGLAEVEVVPQESYPDRKVHTITDAGRAALRDWLGSPLEAEDSREPFLGRLFFADQVDDAGVAALLAARRAQAEETLRSEEHTSELQSRENLVCRLLLEKKNSTETE